MVDPVHSLSCHEAVGAVHLHSHYSDGSLPIEEIAAIAGRKGLDFLMFSDHNTLAPKRAGLEGWHDRVLVLIGCELNDKDDKNHYLAFRLDEEVRGDRAEEYVSRVKEAGGFGVIAHPAEKRKFSDAYPPYPWTEWSVEGFDGIEIWNQLSEWMEGVTRANIMWRIWHPLRSIRFPEWDILHRWDQFNLKRRVVGIGGIDVHAFTVRILGFIPVEIYPYKVQFKSIRTHILTEKPLRGNGSKQSFRDAEKSVFDALTMGRCFVSNFSLGDARGFRFWAERENEYFPMGSRISGTQGTVFHTRTPLKGRIRLMHNNRVMIEEKGTDLFVYTERRGVFRVEVFRKGKGWVYSNPIVITDGEEAL